MQELIEAVARQLAAVGITNVRVSRGSYSHDLYVGGAAYYFHNRRGRTVRIDGEVFRGGKNQVALIVDHILKTLGEKLTQVAKSEELERRTAEADKIATLLQGTGISVYADGVKDELVLTFRHPDKGTIMAAADFLQDNGFAQRSSEVVPEANEEQFIASHMRRLFDMLTAEEKLVFMDDINKHRAKYEEELLEEVKEALGGKE